MLLSWWNYKVNKNPQDSLVVRQSFSGEIMKNKSFLRINREWSANYKREYKDL